MFLEANEFPAKLGRQGSSAVLSRSRILRVLFLFLATASFGADSAPVDCTHLMAWIAGGVSSPKLIRVAQHRGIAFAPSQNLESELRSAGVTPDLLGALRHLRPVHGSSCPASPSAWIFRTQRLTACWALDTMRTNNTLQP